MMSRRARQVALAALIAAGVAWRLPSPKAQGSARLVGVVTDVDSHAGERFSGSLVTNPKDYAKTPGVTVVTVQLPAVPGAPPGQPVDLSKLAIDFGGGNVQRGDRPFTLTPPVGSATVPFRVLLDDLLEPGVSELSPPLGCDDVQLPRGPFPYNTQPIRLECTPRVDPALRLDEMPISAPSAAMIDQVLGISGQLDPLSDIIMDLPDGTLALRRLTQTPRITRLQLPSDISPGPHQLAVGTKLGRVVLHVNLLKLTMSADRLNLLRGESTPFHVEISGAEDIPDSSWRSATPPKDVALDVLRGTPGFKMPRADEEGRVFLRLENRTRQTVTMRPGRDEVELRALSKKDFNKGVYRMDGVIKSQVSGNFSVDGLVLPFLAPVTASPAPR
jgi:hypothetical protein